MGLRRAAPASWAWMDAGLEASKNPGLASFCRPAKQKVNPRKSRKGSSTQPAEYSARGGGPSHRPVGLAAAAGDARRRRARRRLTGAAGLSVSRCSLTTGLASRHDPPGIGRRRLGGPISPSQHVPGTLAKS